MHISLRAGHDETVLRRPDAPSISHSTGGDECWMHKVVEPKYQD